MVCICVHMWVCVCIFVWNKFLFIIIHTFCQASTKTELEVRCFAVCTYVDSHANSTQKSHTKNAHIKLAWNVTEKAKTSQAHYFGTVRNGAKLCGAARATSYHTALACGLLVFLRWCAVFSRGNQRQATQPTRYFCKTCQPWSQAYQMPMYACTHNRYCSVLAPRSYTCTHAKHMLVDKLSTNFVNPVATTKYSFKSVSTLMCTLEPWNWKRSIAFLRCHEHLFPWLQRIRHPPR